MKRRYLLAAIFSLTTACAQKGNFEGKLVNGLSGEPVAGIRLLVKTQSTDFACQVFETTSAEDGTFKVDGTCPDHTYNIEVAKENDTWFLSGATPVTGGELSTGPVELQTWQAPGGSSVYVLSEGELKPVKTASDIDTVTIWNTDVEVRYPNTVPNKVPLVKAGDYLVITGPGNIAKQELHPLAKSEARRFGEPSHYFDMDPWVYIGYALKTDTEYERLEAQLDNSKVTNVKGEGERAARFIAWDALPAGRYAMLGEKERRTYILDFGAAPAPAQE